jgi:hypothetical protein
MGHSQCTVSHGDWKLGNLLQLRMFIKLLFPILSVCMPEQVLYVCTHASIYSLSLHASNKKVKKRTLLHTVQYNFSVYIPINIPNVLKYRSIHCYLITIYQNWQQALDQNWRLSCWTSQQSIWVQILFWKLSVCQKPILKMSVEVPK